jgi:hypothetical protein
MKLFTLLAFACALSGFVQNVQAGRGTVIDSTLDICRIGTSVAGNGSGAYDIAAYPVTGSTICDSANVDFTSPSLIPLNFYGTTYSKVFINENGLLSFGGGISATSTSDLLNIGRPVIAPFFTDLAVTTNDQVSYGWNLFAADDDWFVVNYASESSAGPTRNKFQVIIKGRSDTGAGNFDLIFNYDSIFVDNGNAVAGFSDGAGQGFLFAGSGTPGALLGDSSSDPCNSIGINALPCGLFNTPPDTPSLFGGFVTGRYRFEFRGGVPLAVPGDVAAVPEPPALALMGLGLVMLWRRRVR